MFIVKGWYSAEKSNSIARSAGDKHGCAGVEPMADLVIKARLGEELVFDPKTNQHHAELEARSKPHPQLAEWQSAVQAAEKALAKLAKRLLLWIAFLGLLGIEYAAISELLAGQGMENPHKTVVAIAGSAIFFYLTHMVSKAATRLWLAPLLIAIVFVISMGVLWLENTASEDTSMLANWASAIFLSIAVAGPGLLAKAVFANLVPAEAHAKNRRRLLREIRRAEALRQKAAAEIRTIQNWRSWYVQEANRMRSIYTLAYREASGRSTSTTQPREHQVENPYQS
jgi:hypothetical protein